MIKVAIKTTTKKDLEVLELFRDHLCYMISDESLIKLNAKGWRGNSGGDDAYFGLEGVVVKVEMDK